ncbi:AbrB/MazE/SpoVT family DNA-binding domain-containing protein [Leptolyngbya boryana CZ1]|jgi:putative addiction module antidote|uniref:Addiction module antidote n=2 Tax=Leptolyngbya boryana TaxID=1184 RepID=A0A1Z4JFN3_LEPBY|nr:MULTISPECIES: AbrB/MazE/SpoVT family DNA-binding domain-containing protein [Leptolyngbya]BAY55556.1 addiction module antidote [Leptolyngbya boryana NIES-2135]MBD2371460.1 AbrB/MazE/SpoVT family DNA-binding domain-containing protein [Leptolyngbya sp. FACHB-161]MBD2377971.1 AbrB/MazE/SpoVT family DNA-binding domain-containing protein [Leptolyngbya sp. FACHB-238]MBD2402406.1 AbrB/MazE/SpoVT family DNA-binding domain-containing protein [Leptolyngbya sp. FACHB-239]MBD2408890.1 AbrB/MazE/SpoVT fa
MSNLKVEKVGDALGIVLPEEVLKKLEVKEGDTLYILDTPDGIKITTFDPNLDTAIKAYEKVNQKYTNALRELSK